MSFYGDMQTVAKEMLDLVANNGFGQVVTLTRPGSGGTYDPTTGGVTGGSDVVQTGAGVILDYPLSLRSRGGQGNVPGTLIQEADKNLLLSPLKSDGTALTDPVATDTAAVDGVAYTILSVAKVSPAGVVIYYDCHVRKA